MMCHEAEQGGEAVEPGTWVIFSFTQLHGLLHVPVNCDDTMLCLRGLRRPSLYQ